MCPKHGITAEGKKQFSADQGLWASATDILNQLPTAGSRQSFVREKSGQRPEVLENIVTQSVSHGQLKFSLIRVCLIRQPA